MAPRQSSLLDSPCDQRRERIHVAGAALGPDRCRGFRAGRRQASQTWLVTRPGGSAGRWPPNCRLRQRSSACGWLGWPGCLRSGHPRCAPVPARNGRDIIDIERDLSLCCDGAGHPLTGLRGRTGDIGTTLARGICPATDRRGAERFHWSIRPRITWTCVCAAARDHAALTELRRTPGEHDVGYCTPIPRRRRSGSIRYGAVRGHRLELSPARAAALRPRVGRHVRRGPSQAADWSLPTCARPADQAEISHGLNAMLRFRWRAGELLRVRIARTTYRISGPEENEKGLEDAHVALAQS